MSTILATSLAMSSGTRQAEKTGLSGTAARVASVDALAAPETGSTVGVAADALPSAPLALRFRGRVQTPPTHPPVNSDAGGAGVAVGGAVVVAAAAAWRLAFG